MRAAIQRVVDVELSGIPADARARFQEQIDVEVRQLLELVGARIRRYRETAHLDAPIIKSTKDERAELVSACALLAVDAPRRGQHVDHATFMRAKKNHQKLAREYHPDHNRGVEGEALIELQHQFDAVMKAMLTIEHDYQQRNGDGHGAGDDRSNKHGG